MFPHTTDVPYGHFGMKSVPDPWSMHTLLKNISKLVYHRDVRRSMQLQNACNDPLIPLRTFKVLVWYILIYTSKLIKFLFTYACCLMWKQINFFQCIVGVYIELRDAFSVPNWVFHLKVSVLFLMVQFKSMAVDFWVKGTYDRSHIYISRL